MHTLLYTRSKGDTQRTTHTHGEKKEKERDVDDVDQEDFVSVLVSVSVTTVAITITIVTMVIHVVGNPQTFTNKTGNGKKILTIPHWPRQEKLVQPLVHAHQDAVGVLHIQFA